MSTNEPKPSSAPPDEQASSSSPLRDPTSSSSAGTSSRRELGAVRGRIARLFGIDAPSRDRLLAAMMARHDRDAASYWLLLVLSMGIATLGLVLNSTGVVIGAMLVSPLMGPIVELGMSLVTGSPFLMLRSSIRIGSSVACVVVGAAALTLMLPFREVTTEIAARTAPTVLDLAVAVFCALAAAFATARSSSDTTAAAAGTAISIALVPPLCVVGFGVGTADWPTASGAALLFIANLCAILLFSVLFFLVTGFDTVDVVRLESTGADRARSASKLAMHLRALFGSRYGVVLRVLMPAVLVGVVYIPLRSALEEVTWQVRVRSEVQSLVAAAVPASRAVDSVISVERGSVSLRLVMVTSPEDAARLQSTLRTRVAAAAGVVPSVSVVAVTDANALRVQAEALRSRATPPPVVSHPPPPDPQAALSRLGAELARAWPGGSLGPISRWGARSEGRGIVVTVEHVGSPLGGAAVTLLSREIGTRLSCAVSIVDLGYSDAEHAASAELMSDWLATLTRLAAAARELPRAHLCVRVPSPPSAPPLPLRARARPALPAVDPLLALRPTVEAIARTVPAERLSIVESDTLAVRLSSTPCAPPRPQDAGAAQSAPQTAEAPSPDGGVAP